MKSLLHCQATPSSALVFLQRPRRGRRAFPGWKRWRWGRAPAGGEQDGARAKPQPEPQGYLHAPLSRSYYTMSQAQGRGVTHYTQPPIVTVLLLASAGAIIHSNVLERMARAGFLGCGKATRGVGDCTRPPIWPVQATRGAASSKATCAWSSSFGARRLCVAVWAAGDAYVGPISRAQMDK